MSTSCHKKVTNPTPPFTEIHFSKTINTLNNTLYTPSVMAVIFCLAPELAFHKLSAAVIFQIMICTKHCDWGTKKVRMRRHWKSNSLFVHVGKITGRGRHVIVANLVKLGSWRSHWWRPKATFMMPPPNHYHSVFAANQLIILNMTCYFAWEQKYQCIAPTNRRQSK